MQPDQVAVGYWPAPIPPEDISLARELLSGGLPIAECAGRTCGIWDFDDVIYPGLPGDPEELVLMCWLHGGEEHDVNGGDERLLAAARALANQ